MMELEISATGPLFTGGAQRAMGGFVTAATEAVSDQGVVMVQQRLGEVLKNPTGFYQSRIDTLAQKDYAEVWDQNVVYGPWLERGRPGTRFKGYATFRMVTQQLDKQAGQIAETVLPPFLVQMNG